MFLVSDVFVRPVSHFALGGDQAIFVLVAFLFLLPILVGTRATKRQPELNSVDLPFCRFPVSRAAYALFCNDLRGRG